MKIFIIGYGKMGKMIESLAVNAGYEVVAIVDAGQFWPRFTELDKPDVAIEFTQPDAVVDNIKHCVVENTNCYGNNGMGKIQR